jgi:predicted O-methyltransferase YrrM
MFLGVLPIVDHYYQPLINPKKHLKKSLRDDRDLPGIDFNTAEQLDLLSKFNYNEELLEFPLQKRKDTEYYYNNYSFTSGDGEYLYNMVRHFKPGKIIEVGSGLSTLMILNGVNKNKMVNPDYVCRHICIEPYEKQWLEEINVELFRKKVEDVDKSLFEELDANDILFIDSSHMIRPQGDVLFEFLEVLPILKPGTIIHIHDIFTPKDYRDEWIYNHTLWNEQYLLEAFLQFNNSFRIFGALNYLTHHYRKELAEKCPVFENQPAQEPGSFWMIKN